MSKKVRYNGRTESYKHCSDPGLLVVGKEYEVISAVDFGYQTNYTLRGVQGTFNSVWFDKVDENEEAENLQVRVYIAVSKDLPKIGERYYCAKVEFIDGKPKLVRCTTSAISKIKFMGNNTYSVETRNSTYIVKVAIPK